MFGSNRKISLPKALYDQLEDAAKEKGYSSVDEFVTHVLEREVSGNKPPAAPEEVQKQLRGLGYIE